MIFKATCPVCGLFTRISDPQEPYQSCSCKQPYTVEPDTDYNTPEELAQWQSTQSSN